MAKRVFIFGAGASKHLGAPLMAEFIDTAHDVRETHGGLSTEAFDLVFEFIDRRLPTLHAKSNVDLGNLESVFSLFEMGRLLGRLPGTAPEDIDKAVAAMRRVLAETLQWTCQFPVDPDRGIHPSSPYLSIAQVVEEDGHRGGPASVACLTFDYDLGLDFALHWSNLTIDYGLGEPVRGAVPVLKLHGSLNWLLCPACAAISVISLAEVFRQQPRRTDKKTQAILLTSALANHPGHCSGAKHDGQPAIVPPSWNKTQYHEKFGPIWKRAAAELAEAQEVTVIGYSLPASDGFFRDLLALSLAEGARLRRFTVVDTSKDTIQRFRDLLGPQVRPKFVEQVRTFEDFAKKDLGANKRDRGNPLVWGM